jgi:hypothetical protein
MITTGGVPEGIPSDPPRIREKINRIAPRAQAPRTTACTLLLRSMGNLGERLVYCGGIADFLEGSAKCIVFESAGLPAPLCRRQKMRRMVASTIEDFGRS